MKINKISKKLILAFILAIIILTTKAYAVGSFSISASNTTINKGESVTVTIKGNNAYGQVNISATNATVSASSVFLQNDTKTVTVTSNSTQDIKITVSPSSSGLGDIDENPITGSQSLTIKINNTASSTGGTSTTGGTTSTTNNNNNNKPTTVEKSSVATLSNLGITPNDFSGFKANTYSYNVEVPNETEKIEVYAKKGQSGQTISGAGAKTLKEGTNTFSVVVTAEDEKTQKTYTINVTRKAKEENEPEEEPEEETEETPEEDPMEEIFGLSQLKIEGLQLEPQFQTDVYEYKVELKEDLEKLNITTLATEVNSKIEITGNENFVEGENVITIIVKGENEEKTATYQIIVNKTITATENTIDTEVDHQKMIRKIFAISVIGMIIIIAIIAIIVKVKKTNNQLDEYIPYEDDNYEEDEVEETIVDNSEEDEIYDEKIKKKKRSKGKRFK